MVQPAEQMFCWFSFGSRVQTWRQCIGSGGAGVAFRASVLKNSLKLKRQISSEATHALTRRQAERLGVYEQDKLGVVDNFIDAYNKQT